MNLQVLEVIIGIIFIYLLLSLFVTTLQEIVSSLLKLRSKGLEQGIRRMLNDESQSKLSEDFFNNSLIKYLGKDDQSKPSYLASNNVSHAIVSILKASPGLTEAEVSIEEGINKLPEGATKKLLLEYWHASENNVNRFRDHLEKWFDDSMDRVSGWYKRRVQVIVIIIGFVIAITINIDTFHVYKVLSTDNSKRQALVEVAQNQINAYNAVKDSAASVKDTMVHQLQGELLTSIKTANSQLDDLKTENNLLGLGWTSFESVKMLRWYDWLLKILGCLVTALAASLGSQFWFDTLSKIMSIRNAGKIPEQKGKTSITKTS